MRWRKKAKLNVPRSPLLSRALGSKLTSLAPENEGDINFAYVLLIRNFHRQRNS